MDGEDVSALVVFVAAAIGGLVGWSLRGLIYERKEDR